MMRQPAYGVLRGQNIVVEAAWFGILESLLLVAPTGMALTRSGQNASGCIQLPVLVRRWRKQCRFEIGQADEDSVSFFNRSASESGCTKLPHCLVYRVALSPAPSLSLDDALSVTSSIGKRPRARSLEVLLRYRLHTGPHSSQEAARVLPTNAQRNMLSSLFRSQERVRVQSVERQIVRLWVWC